MSIQRNFRLNINTKKCRTYKGFYPNVIPVIYNLSSNTSVHGTYSLVYITGNNFLFDGAVRVNFGSFTNLPITFYGSTNISFIVPLDAPPGTYEVRVTSINYTQVTPTFIYSNYVNYTLT
jgi:hypothetical protein